MSAAINQSSGQGALFELVARGVKDTYFVKDSADSYFPYDARYKSSIPHLPERKTMIPINGTRFGNTFEVEIESYGDILTECALEIDLPTWLPPLPRLHAADIPVSSEVVNGLYPITTSGSEDSYGYVNYVGYFLFEKIQFYQDQFLLQEWSGDGLLMKQLTEGSLDSSGLRLTHSNGLASGNTARAIQLRATPGHLRIILPIPGTQCPEDGGFPLICLPWQTFRIKATLRKLEDLVICSDTTKNKPAPWAVPSMHYTMADRNTFVFVPKSIYDIGQPTIVLSTIQHYVSPETQKELRDKKIEIPFRRQFENLFTFGELDYIPLDKGGQAVVTRRLDGRHPTERVMWVFRNTNALENNRLDNFYNEYFTVFPPTAVQPYLDGEFYYRIKLVIAGKDREDLHDPHVWNSITQWAKHERGTDIHIGSMMWSTGDDYGAIYPAKRSPEGTINFTTADRPTLFIELANITTNPLLAQRKAEMHVVLEGWNNYIIEDNRGRLMFSN
jgi:hypothetical protein